MRHHAQPTQSVQVEEAHSVEQERPVVRIYLAGAVPKGADDHQGRLEMWSAEDESLIRRRLRAALVETINPNRSGVQRADFYANFGCDLHLVDSSDVVFVDGRGKRGIGVGAEMMFAQMRGTRVVAICPDESAYRRRNVRDMFGEDLEEWIHPFVYGLTDHIAATLEEAVGWVDGWVKAGRPPKGAGDIDRAIEYYRSIAGISECNRVACCDDDRPLGMHVEAELRAARS